MGNHLGKKYIKSSIDKKIDGYKSFFVVSVAALIHSLLAIYCLLIKADNILEVIIITLWIISIIWLYIPIFMKLSKLYKYIKKLEKIKIDEENNKIKIKNRYEEEDEQLPCWTLFKDDIEK